MEKKNIITIAGKPGSGKSTTSKGIGKKLGYTHFSSGDLMRTLGQERGMDIYATNVFAEKDQSLDQLVDQKLKEIGENDDNVVIDSRMAWHWMPQSFKIYLELDLKTAAERILTYADAERKAREEIPDDVDEYAAILQKRLNSEIKRYQNLYQVDPYNPEQYDLVVDTEKNNPEEVIALVIEKFNEWKNK